MFNKRYGPQGKFVVGIKRCIAEDRSVECFYGPQG